MMELALYRLSIPFAIVTGCIAGLLAAMSWKILRESPFGTALQLLAAVMSMATIYHGGLLVLGSETLLLRSLLLFGYVLVPVAVYTAVAETRGEIRIRDALKHETVFLATVLGLFLYAVGGSVSEFLFPPALHWVHGFAALFAIGGLYCPVRDDLQNEPWTELPLDDAAAGRHHPSWMLPVDDAVLDVLYDSGLVLTPAVVAYNIGYNRDEVNRRLTKLASEGLVERVERGKYRLTRRGERYIEGADAPP
jgi:predicted transcriptional regulator